MEPPQFELLQRFFDDQWKAPTQKSLPDPGLGDGFQRSELLDAGVADQQVQAAELRYHRADQLVGLRRVGDVAREGRRGPPLIDS